MFRDFMYHSWTKGIHTFISSRNGKEITDHTSTSKILKIGPIMAFFILQGTILKAFCNCKGLNYSKSCSGNTYCQESPNLGILQNIYLHMVQFGFLTAHTSGNSKPRGPSWKNCFYSLFWPYYLASYSRSVILNKSFFQNKTYFLLEFKQQSYSATWIIPLDKCQNI